MWGEHQKAAVKSTEWRKETARNVYLDIQDANNHLFFAFILIVSPTACSAPNFGKAVTDLILLNEKEPVQLMPNSEAKAFLESVAADRGFLDNRRYTSFMNCLFSSGKSVAYFQNITNSYKPDQPPTKRPRLAESSPPTDVLTSGTSYRISTLR